MTLVDEVAGTLTASGLDPARAEETARGVVVGSGAGLDEAGPQLGLLSLDFEQIQRTVMASPRPVTIFGASSSIRRWDEDMAGGRVKALPNGSTVLFSGAGNALILLPDGSAEALGRVGAALVRELRERTGGESSYAGLSLSPRELAVGPPDAVEADALESLGWSSKGGGFGGWLARLSTRLRAAKGEDRGHPFLQHSTTVARCSECARRPREVGPLCRRCNMYRTLGAEQKRNAEMARSFDEVLGTARRIAFVHIDGVGIGSRVSGLRTLRGYRAVSDALKRAFEDPSQWMSELGLDSDRFQVVVSGGDDLMLVMPGFWSGPEGRSIHALEATARILRRIEHALDDVAEYLPAGDPGVGAGAGVVFARKLPADFVFQRAEDLCRQAKTVLAREGSDDRTARSAIAFEIIQGGAMYARGKPNSRVVRAVLGPRPPEKLWLSQGPWTLPAFERLLDVANGVNSSGIGASTLVGLRDALDANPATVGLSWAYQLARHKKLRDVLGARLDRPLAEMCEWLVQPKRGNPGEFATGIQDILQVLQVRRGR